MVASRSHISARVARLLPKGLATQLTLTVVVTNLVVFSALLLVAVAGAHVLVLTLPDPNITQVLQGFNWTLILGGLAAALVGSAGVGFLIARVMARPVTGLAAAIEAYGANAELDALATFASEEPLLPHEFVVLQETLLHTLAKLAEHEEALARAKEEAEAANVTLSVAVHDSLEGKIVVTDSMLTLVNPAASSHLGLAHALTLVGSSESLPLEKLFSSATVETETGQPIDPATLLDRRFAQPVTARVRADGRPARWIELSSLPHASGRGTSLITTRDVTEQRRVDELRNEILGLVSHDLRAPLTVITGYLDLLARQTGDPTATRAITSAQRSAARMQELLEDLLSATRAEEMFAPTEFARISLRELAEETVVSFQHTSPHELRIDSDCEGIVIGEEKRLRQVLVNLVTNAMKYSPADTVIDVSLRCDEQVARLAVEDRGPGVPESERERVFERFARLDSGDEAPRPGVGLGLYIVRAIVESHGGRVAVEGRTDGPGARFVVVLPLAPHAENRR